MNFLLDSVVSLAATGTPVEAHLAFRDGSEDVVPVVAWASVVRYIDEENDAVETEVSPIMLYEGATWTRRELREDFKGVRITLRLVRPSAG